MPDTSPLLDLPLILPAQAQKHVTHNEALRLLDILVQLAVASRDLSAPPPDPQDGDRHIVATGAAGAWSGRDGAVAIREVGQWSFLTPRIGWRAHVVSEGRMVAWDGTLWAPDAMATLGINTGADTINRFAVASDAALFGHAGSDHRLKINKATDTDTASLLFQSAYTGHAEMGLAGDTSFSVRTSPDGASWTTALAVDPGSGGAVLPQGARIDGPLTGAGLVGTVAMDAGVPSGAAMQGGGTADGRWIRFADGTQICMATLTLVPDGADRLSADWSFPIPFADGSDVGVSASLASEDGFAPPPQDLGWFGARRGDGPGHLGASVRLYRRGGATDFAATDTGTAHVTATGRWA